MRTGIMAVLCAAVVLAACGMAAAQEAAKPKAKPPTTIYNVPQRPQDIVERFLDLDEKQRGAIGKLRQEYILEQYAAMQKVQQELDKKYLGQVLAAVPDDTKPIFKGILAAIDAYHESLKAADDEFRAIWKKVLGVDMVAMPYSALQIFFALPGLDAERKTELQRTLYRETYAKQQAEVQKVAEARGIKRPEGRDRNGWRDYMTQTADITRTVRQKLEAEKLT